MTCRLVLLSTSPRVAPGLLTGRAWSTLRSAGSVRATEGHPLLTHLAADGIRVQVEDTTDPPALAGRLTGSSAQHSCVVWLLGPDGDAGLREALRAVIDDAVPEPGSAPDVVVLAGSFDLPGARLLDLVATMDRLRSPGGCPWDAQQTHTSLATYLLEETYETLEAIETADRTHLREELGDLLLQVVFHSRIAAEDPADPWSVDEVADDIVEKLVRRHPHVFGATSTSTPTSTSAPTTAEDVEASWHLRKAAEKGRSSAVDGVPPALPALSLAAKLMHRARSHGVEVPVPEAGDDGLGSRLLLLVAEAQSAGLDAEAELRATARRYADRVRAAEAPAVDAP